ncbi:CBN-SCL-23 protein [Caenorhabditis brenneri]|uniref:CBN-SCL-23 protein n=1 Tax=Caenorhabditis brenneri TaxID=135651 RepID=G0P9H7_CAEBE|nr:CBN-SCL-23 protein [Caenorhabditis brenneri]
MSGSMQIAETEAIERRTVGSEGSNGGKEEEEDLTYEYNDEGGSGRRENDADEIKKINKENGRNKEKNAGTSSSDSGLLQNNYKRIFIALVVIILSYNILTVTNPRPSRYSVITKMAPQHCGLNLAARIQNLILDVSALFFTPFSPLTDSFICLLFTQKHNEIRSKVALGQYVVDDGYLPPAANMPKLVWDCELELEAQNKAKECNLDEGKMSGKFSGLDEIRGENAFYFRTDPLDFSDGVMKGIHRMGDEISIAGIKNLKMSRYDKRIGHATQIIWGETRKVGCAVQECSPRNDGSLDGQKYNVAVCKYYPTGNVFKSSTPTSIYMIGDSGSSCSEGTFVDPTSGLCVEATWHEKTEENGKE